ncbi:MAG: glycosyltransferase family 2 protein, partial [Verrucomicrobiota bacterium]
MNTPSQSTPLRLAIPCFNGATYLQATLESLSVNRPWVSWHLQDGASRDNSADIGRRLASPADHVVSLPDKGQADALNQAIRQMGGDIIGFINADDLLAEGAAQAVLDHFEAHPEVDLVYGEVEWVDADGRVTGRHAGRIDSLADCLDVYNVWWAKRQWVQPEVFFRRRLWEKVGGFDTRYHLAFDYDYWVRCFLAGARVSRLPRVLARFRLHVAQKSADAKRAADEIRDIVASHLPLVPGGAPRGLARRLAYDRYHAGQDHAALSMPAMLLRNPSWALLPDVR